MYHRYITLLVGSVAVVVGLIVTTVCVVRPYHRPVYVEIDTSESAFLIPLEGDTGDQAAFESIRFLEQKKVAAKRLLIPHRWNQTGRLPSQGDWIPVVRLVKVDRRPCTREWTRSATSGTSTSDQAIHAESRDSINFSMGVSCTANIPEELAALFLYSYPSKSLSDMLDLEVRARVQQIVAEQAGKYDLEAMRSKKNEIMSAVKENVVPFFRERGIEITTIGMVGGLTYDNPGIQKVIDDAVKTSQLKVVAEAKREEQEVQNKTLKLAADGKALAERIEAQAKADAELIRIEGEAKGRLRQAEAEAEAYRKLAEAKAHEIKAMGSPTLYLQLKTLEAETTKWKQWKGTYPTWWMVVGNVSELIKPPAYPDQRPTIPTEVKNQ